MTAVNVTKWNYQIRQCMWMSASQCHSNEGGDLCVLIPWVSVHLPSFSLIFIVTGGPFNSVPTPFCAEQLKCSPPALFILYTINILRFFKDLASLGSLALSSRCLCLSLPAAGSIDIDKYSQCCFYKPLLLDCFRFIWKAERVLICKVKFYIQIWSPPPI